MTTVCERKKHVARNALRSGKAVSLRVVVERLASAAESIDRDAKVIRGVKILGLRSRNPARVLGIDPREPFDPNAPYSYAPAALKEAAALYEGASVFIDHPEFRYGPDGRREPIPGDRKTHEKFGRIVNVRFVPESGLFGDLEYLASHPLAEMVLETAARMPDQLALSHNASAIPEVQQDGSVIITRIAQVRSVDLIGAEPGTTTSLFESTPQEEAVKTTTPKAVIEACGPRLKGATNLVRVLEMDGMDAMGEVSMDAPPEATSAEDQVREAFRAMVLAVLDDAALDTSGVVAKIKEILDARDSLLAPKPAEKPAAEADADPESKPGEKPAMESAEVAALRRKLAETESREMARTLMESANADLEARKLPVIRIDSVKIAAVAALPDDAARKALIKTWESVAPIERPRSAPPLHVEADMLENYRPDPKAFAASIRS